jgi:hypothetical protein
MLEGRKGILFGVGGVRPAGYMAPEVKRRLVSCIVALACKATPVYHLKIV